MKKLINYFIALNSNGGIDILSMMENYFFYLRNILLAGSVLLLVNLHFAGHNIIYGMDLVNIVTLPLAAFVSFSVGIFISVTIEKVKELIYMKI